MNENTFYKVGPSGILRTTDSGDSWHPFTNGMVGTKVRDLVAFNNRLYVYTGTGFFKSVDDGNSWEEVRIDYGEFTSKPTSNGAQPANYFTDSKLIIANNVLYGIVPQGKELRIFRLRPDDGVFSIAHRISFPKLWTSGEDAKVTNLSDTEEKSGDLKEITHRIAKEYLKSGGFAVSGETVYIEYMRKLLKWTPGSTDAIDTGLTDTDKHIDDALDRGFKIAASAETVYVGKRDGKLFQSIDGGNSWRDVTPNILSSSSQIKDIIFVGSTVYVATDIGVMTSGDGERWSLLTDTDNIGTPIIIDRFAMEGSSFYGAGGKGVYSLDSRGRWEQILANIPDKVISLSASHDKLYIGTEKRGIFHTSLGEDAPEVKTASVQEAQ